MPVVAAGHKGIACKQMIFEHFNLIYKYLPNTSWANVSAEQKASALGMLCFVMSSVAAVLNQIFDFMPDSNF